MEVHKKSSVATKQRGRLRGARLTTGMVSATEEEQRGSKSFYSGADEGV